MRLKPFLPILLAVAIPASAQTLQQKAIVPVAAVALPGAYGSIWTTILAAYNPTGSSVPVRLGSPGPCLICDAYSEPLRPHESKVWNQISAPIPGMGMFVYVGDSSARDDVAAISLTLRIQDVSRQALSWGTEIPIVREKDLFTASVSLVNVPTDDRFRSALRIYDFDLRTSEVLVRILSMADGTLLAEKNVTLTSAPYPAETVPAQFTVGDLRAFAAIPSGTSVRVEIRPVTPNMRFWAFATVANNETQQVTAITPRGVL